MDRFMRALSKGRFDYTEREMADAFMELLQSKEGLPSVGTFDRVYRDVYCYQGRPDFIALHNKKHIQPPKLPESMGFVGPAILATLKPNATRTFRYLVSHLEFSEGSIKRMLSQLLACDYVERVDTGSFRLGDSASWLQVELWAFELKLNNPKRAVFQAQQCCAYANRTVIVVPPGQDKHYMRYHMALTRWGIGLATFNPANRDFKISRRSRIYRAIIPLHQIYALSQIGS
jgi:hypothetical protein